MLSLMIFLISVITFGKYVSRMKGPRSLMPKMLIKVLINGSAMLVGSSRVINVVMIAEKVTWQDNDGDHSDKMIIM